MSTSVMGFREALRHPAAFAAIVPPPTGARGRITILANPITGSEWGWCEFCQQRIELNLDEWSLLGYDETRSALRSALAPHWHVPPQPMTDAEREAVRVRGVHRRGSLRCE